jgi:hypothetical protein
MGAADGLCTCFAEAEVFDLACFNELLDSAGGIFDQSVRVDPMLVEKVDGVGL